MTRTEYEIFPDERAVIRYILRATDDLNYDFFDENEVHEKENNEKNKSITREEKYFLENFLEPWRKNRKKGSADDDE